MTLFDQVRYAVEKRQEVKPGMEKRINDWWQCVEMLYVSNELTESQYRTQKELLKQKIGELLGAE